MKAKEKERKTFISTVWFKILLVVLMFLPAYSQVAYDPINTSEVIALVLSKPVITSISWLLPVSKFILLSVVVFSFFYSTSPKNLSSKILLGYYFVILLIVGIFQNMSYTDEYGFVWLIGNTLVMLVISLICITDVIKNKTTIRRENFRKDRLWIVVLMLLAFLMPYSVNASNNISPSFSLNILYNESGLTYCMITPVIIGVLLLFSDGVDKLTLSIISYVGLLFGIMNILTWFVFNQNNWWMGVLHLPLVIISFLGLIDKRITRQRRTQGHTCII